MGGQLRLSDECGLIQSRRDYVSAEIGTWSGAAVAASKQAGTGGKLQGAAGGRSGASVVRS